MKTILSITLLFFASTAMAECDKNHELIVGAKAFAEATGTTLNDILSQSIQQRINENNKFQSEKDHKVSSVLGLGEIPAWNENEKYLMDTGIQLNNQQIAIYAKCYEDVVPPETGGK